MPRRKFIDKKNATTFALVHRAGDDPLIHDADAPSMVFAEKPSLQPRQLRRAREEDYAYSDVGSVASGSQSGYRSSKVKQRGDLEEEFGLDFRPTEGQAAQQGVFFDDTEYDYMQHMRDLGGEGGAGGGSVQWVEASAPPPKRRQKLEDALRSLEIDGDERSVGTADTGVSKARSLLPEEVLPSEFVRKRTYQDQQDVPDAIAGFQPDMDPRLREVLEALEDEEYVDDQDDDDVFGQLMGDGEEVDEDEFEMMGEQMMYEEGGGGGALDDDDGWESDDTVKASSSPPSTQTPAVSLDELKEQGEMIHPPSNTQAQLPADPTAGAWLDEYKKFKSSKPSTNDESTPSSNSNLPPPGTSTAALAAPPAPPSYVQSLAAKSRKSRRGPAASTNFSMTSSTLARTDHQRLLDARFDKLENDYATSRFPEDDEFPDHVSGLGSLASAATGRTNASNARSISGMSGISTASRASTLSQVRATGPKSVRQDFDGMIDDFLASTGTAKGAKRRAFRGKGKLGGEGGEEGLRELDEVRKGLGPARVKGASAVASGGADT